MPDHSTSAVAYSYIRFSTGEQAKGDSLRRQTEKAEAYCQRKGLALDERLTLRDLGVSAYRGDNALVGNLGVFLEAIKRKTVLPGSVLIVESVDRISRQGIDEGYDIIKTILKAGVLLVTLSPEREFGADAVKSLSKGALELQLILERAAEESERKSERVGAAWTRKKAAARGGKVMSKRLPAWVRNDGGKLVLIPEAAAAVREVFRLALSGYGIPAIIKTLTANGVPAIGTTGRWTRAYLSLLLRDRRVLGEYQPRRGKATDGEVIANYYPAMLTEEQWRDLRNCIGQRRRNSGRPGKAQVNIFKGLLRHARDGDSYIMSQRFSRSPGKPTRKYAVLVNSEGDQGRARLYSIPYDGLENAVLTALREIDAHDILNGDQPPDETTSLSAAQTGVEAELAEATAFMNAHGFSPTIGKRVASLEERFKELGERLAEARQRAEHPVSESWGEAQTLAEVLASSSDPHDTRLRLRRALRSIVTTIQMLIVPRGLDRIIALQMWFAGSKRHRDYLLLYRPMRAHEPGGWSEPKSIAAVHVSGNLDLRQPAHAKRLEAALAAIDLTTLEAALPELDG